MKISAVIAGAVVLAASLTSAHAGTDLVYTTLTLKNGWKTETIAPAIAIDQNNIVHFKGAMSQTPPGLDIAFTVPFKFRAGRFVAIPVITSGSTVSDLYIFPNGDAHIIEPINGIGQSKPYTALESATYAKN